MAFGSLIIYTHYKYVSVPLLAVMRLNFLYFWCIDF